LIDVWVGNGKKEGVTNFEDQKQKEKLILRRSSSLYNYWAQGRAGKVYKRTASTVDPRGGRKKTSNAKTSRDKRRTEDGRGSLEPRRFEDC